MKHLVLFLCTLICLHVPALSFAGPKEDYEESYKLYIAAATSAAAYNDRVGELATRYLQQEGWNIDHFIQTDDQAGARFLIATKQSDFGKNTYILAIVGTETAEDVKMDLKFDKVYFAGSSTEEFAANAVKKNVSASEPKVHRGFNQFIQAGPAAILHNDQSSFSLPGLLKNSQDSKLFLTGHSLGGAAATLAGARLISMGVRPEQIEVITFGAPAVGNKAFADKFEPQLNLTRVVMSGDPVTGALQTMVGGYKQFGREIKWRKPATIKDTHKLPGYVDLAMKNYYDKRQIAINRGLELPRPVVQGTMPDRVYIVPLANNLPNELRHEFFYMREALLDEYGRQIPNYIIETKDVGDDWQQEAIAAGCRWVIVTQVSGLRLKNEKNTFYITFTQIVYEAATGAMADTAAFATGTYNLTPLEAFIHTVKGVNTLPDSWLVRTNR